MHRTSLLGYFTCFIFKRAIEELEKSKKSVNLKDLPQGLARLLELSKDREVVKEKSGLEDLADDIEKLPQIYQIISLSHCFIGAVIISLGEWLSGKSVMRWNDFIECSRKCGASALPIVTLISFLTGLTMAFVGSVFGEV